ncbi:GNAT family N-acetyltransferase [Belliella sp. R4-6]|uniref:GNAT family N-acetyltransferase n=1 Tax=Belliella alkalica TaxID=1730871 RepID=A0ABS9VG37_9BACT|nr:GNAT family protein [Belliella alkalica]MCH7415406.1 GNAT family N-acetyltransferase [Belliella alkalica]
MDINFDLILENENIKLRPIQLSDIEKLSLLTNNPGMWRFFTHDLSNPLDFQLWLEPAFDQKRLQFVIIDKKNDKIVGTTAFGNLYALDKRIEIGWTWLGKDFQGIGINTKVKQLMLIYAFEILGMERVEFKTDVLNSQSRSALKNISAIEEGVLRSHMLMTNGRRRDTVYFSILKSEWPHVKRENNW